MTMMVWESVEVARLMLGVLKEDVVENIKKRDGKRSFWPFYT